MRDAPAFDRSGGPLPSPDVSAVPVRFARKWAHWFTVVACLAVFACAFLPWATSGRASRSSYALARSAERLDLINAAWQRGLVVGWYFMPLAVAALWLAAVARRPFAVAALGTGVGALAVIGALAVRSTRLQPEFGTSATIVAGGLAVVGAVATAWNQKEIR